jgi:hypothetical protein
MIARELVIRKLALIAGDLAELRLVESGHPPPSDYFEYNDLDAAKVYEALQGAVKDIPEYLRHVHQYVEKPRPG